MIILYSERQIALVKKACDVVVACHEVVSGMCRPGVATIEIDNAVKNALSRYSASSAFLGYEISGKPPFPGYACISVNDVVIHGIGDDTRLLDGDIVSVDIGAKLGGYIGDSAWTYQVGGESPRTKAIIVAAEEALLAGFAAARPNRPLLDVCLAIGNKISSLGFKPIREYVGHGVGGALHEDPKIPNYVDDAMKRELAHVRLKPGMILAIEPMITDGSGEIARIENYPGWPVRTADGSLASHAEHTIAIMRDHPEILTLKPWDKIPVFLS